MDASSSEPAAERAALVLSGFLPYRLNVVAASVSEGLARTYGERFGIGVPEWRVLATVGEFRSITAAALGQHARMGKVKVSRAAAALERRDLLARRPNPRDGREAFLVLTTAGEAMLAEIVPLALAYARDLTEGLSDRDAAALDRLLDALLERATRMGAGSPDRGPDARRGRR